MEQICLVIRTKETGERIKELMERYGYTVKDLQEAIGLESPQSIYKWMAGKSLPTLDNLLILSRALHTTIEGILVIDGDVSISEAARMRKKFTA